jgi:cellobiose-specific phosphotransferase system component IIA
MFSIILLLLIIVLGAILFYMRTEIISIQENARREQKKLIHRFSKYENLASQDDYLKQLNAKIKFREILISKEDYLKQLNEKIELREIAISKEDYLSELESQISTCENESKRLENEKQQITAQIKLLQKQLQPLEEADYLQAVTFYEPEYDFDTSEEYKEKLTSIRQEQKQLIKDKLAVISKVALTMEGSRRAGQKITNTLIKLVLRAFNGECDAAIAKVKYNNFDALERRINKAYEALNKLAEITYCTISETYLGLKLDELHLAYEYQEKKYEEREEQRRIREQMREEQRALKEIEKAKEQAEREEQRYQQALEKARQEVEQATGQQRDKLEEQIKYLSQQLEEAHTNAERAVSRAQMTKSGHVYIISNIGSFGENVYKIGMTRRLEPMDRVKELGDASVPFPFDVHAMIFTENAPELESSLHKLFHTRRFNKANERKEFFRVSLSEIIDAVEKLSSNNKYIKSDIHITKVAEAVEYRKSLAIERKFPSDKAPSV